MSNYLTEAFKQLSILEEETFAIDDDGIKELEDFVDADEQAEDTIEVIDAEADTEDEIKDEYVGDIIIDCAICHSKFYKKPEEIITSEDSELVNVDEECPYCTSMDGYTIIGEVAPFNPNGAEAQEPVDADADEDDTAAEDTTEEDTDKPIAEAVGDHFYVKGTDSKGNETTVTGKTAAEAEAAAKKLGSNFNKVVSGRVVGGVDKPDPEKVAESLDKIELEVDNQKIEIETKPCDECDQEAEAADETVVAPLSDETTDEITAANEDDGTIDIDFEDIDEREFDELGESYLKKVYSNVDSYKTLKAKDLGSSIVLEGMITFNNGHKKATTFKFTPYQATESGKVKFIGENKEITKGRAFKLSGYVANKNLICESLSYRYNTRNLNESKSTRLYGMVKTAKCRTKKG